MREFPGAHLVGSKSINLSLSQSGNPQTRMDMTLLSCSNPPGITTSFESAMSPLCEPSRWLDLHLSMGLISNSFPAQDKALLIVRASSIVMLTI